MACESPQGRTGLRYRGAVQSYPASNSTRCLWSSGCFRRWQILHRSLDNKISTMSERPTHSVRSLSVLRFCTQTVTHFLIIKYLPIPCSVGGTKNMLRLEIRIIITITYTVRALNPFPRTSPAIISAKCFPKRGKRIQAEGIFKSTGQGLTQRGLRDS